MKRSPKMFVRLLAVVIMLIIVGGCASMEKHRYKEIKLGFSHNGNQLSGSIILPKNSAGPFPVLVFVHGDGPTPYDSFGYYRYLWNRLAENGIAAYAWSKPGVEESSGNWLSQSMDDRADEAIAAIEMLKQRDDIAANKIGLIGYSQGGWVLPLVAKKSLYPDFMILVSGAINWLDQGDFLGRERLKREGFSDARIAQALACSKRGLQVLQSTSSYQDYLQDRENMPSECKETDSGEMSPDRFEFVKLNWRSDAREGLAAVQCPTLGVFGDQDINVDFAESVREYKRIFAQSGNPDLSTKIYPGAQHALFKNEYVDDMRPGIWAAIKMEFLEEAVFADGYLDFVANWIKKTTASK